MQSGNQALSPLPVCLSCSAGTATGRPNPACLWAVMPHAFLFQLQGTLLCSAFALVKHVARCAPGKIRNSKWICAENSSLGKNESLTKVAGQRVTLPSSLLYDEYIVELSRPQMKVLERQDTLNKKVWEQKLREPVCNSGLYQEVSVKDQHFRAFWSKDTVWNWATEH